jgi:hypothetical protein
MHAKNLTFWTNVRTFVHGDQLFYNCYASLKPGGNYIWTAMFSTKNSAFNHKHIYAFLLTLTINSYYSNVMQICFIFKSAVHDSGGQSLTSHCGGPGSMSGLSMWDLLRIKKSRDRFLFEVIGFPLS